jgi:hypothetical protein
MQKIYFLLCLILGLFYAIPQSEAQVPGMRKYTQQDGFSATNGYEFEQDERGFLWIGTDNGGVSFDGKKFRGLLEKGDFPDAEILAIKSLTYDRTLLVPITHSVCYLDKGILITEKEDARLRDIRNANHNVAFGDHATKAYWLSDGGKLNTLFRFSGKAIKRYDIGNDSFTIHRINSDFFIGSLLVDSLRNLSYPCIYNLTTGTYQYCYNEAGRKISPMEGFVNSRVDMSYLISYHEGNRQINVYKYKANDSILKLTKTIDLIKYKQRQNPLLVLVDRNRDLWVKFIGREGVWYYGNVMKNITKQEALHIQEPRMINSIFIDRNSNLWMSAQNNALYFISKKHIRNALLTNRFPLKEEVPKTISGDGKGKLLISYVDNTTLICSNGTQYKSVPLNGFFREGARGIIPVKDNYFLVFGGQPALYDIGTNKITYIGSSVITCKDVCFYKENDLLIASPGNVVHIAAYRSRQPVIKHVFQGRSTSVSVLQNGHILIGTPTGLYLKQSLEADALKINDPLLDQCNITDIQSLPDGAALIGTNARGLFLYKTDKSIQAIKVEELKHVRSIYKQNDSVYWASTNKGVYSFIFDHNRTVKAVKNYTFYDGLPSNNATSVYVCRDTAYVATSEGIGVLPLKDSTLLQMAPPDIYLNTVQTDKTTIWYPDSLISLPPDQKSLLISLSAISYESLGNIQYYYRLYPLQTQWILTTDPDIRYAQLPPGKYTFQAYALNAKGVKSQRTIVLDIYIEPAFWQTLNCPARSCCSFILLIVALVAIAQGKEKVYEDAG